MRSIVLVIILVIGFQGFDLNNKMSVKAQTVESDPFIERTGDYIIEVNDLVDTYLIGLKNYHKLNLDTNIKHIDKNIPILMDKVLSPPNAIYSITENSIKYQNEMLSKCRNNFEKQSVNQYNFEFNLSSTCLRVELKNKLLLLTKDFETKGYVGLTENIKTFLLTELDEVNNMLLEFYSQIYTAKIMSSSYSNLTSEVIQLNDNLSNIYSEIKKYSNALPNASTTKCS